MFSLAQKRYLAAKIERLLLEMGHPEMPTEKPKFKLHIDGKAEWSYADIVPNWVFDDGLSIPAVNPHNEKMAVNCTPTTGKTDAVAILASQRLGKGELVDNFYGDDALLISSTQALLDLDAKNALVPHGIGGHARNLLSALASRLMNRNSQLT